VRNRTSLCLCVYPVGSLESRAGQTVLFLNMSQVPDH